MDPERQREIASMGGRASHGGRGSDYESEESQDESPSSGRGMRGGNREQHAEAGRRGAESRWGNNDDDR